MNEVLISVFVFIFYVVRYGKVVLILVYRSYLKHLSGGHVRIGTQTVLCTRKLVPFWPFVCNIRNAELIGNPLHYFQIFPDLIFGVFIIFMAGVRLKKVYLPYSYKWPCLLCFIPVGVDYLECLER